MMPEHLAWITITGATFVLTYLALIEAQRDRAAVSALNGKAREIATGASVRRAWFALAVQAAFLLAGIGAALVWGRAPIVALLIAGALFLFVSTAWDRLDSKRLTATLRELAK